MLITSEEEKMLNNILFKKSIDKFLYSLMNSESYLAWVLLFVGMPVLIFACMGLFMGALAAIMMIL